MPKGKRNQMRKIKVKAPPPLSKEDAEFEADFSTMRPQSKGIRDRFCQEYMRDFNGSAAIRRMGYKSPQPGVRACEFMKEPYVQWKLQQLMEAADEKAIMTKGQLLMNMKREALDRVGNSGAERIAALRGIAKSLGFEVTKVEGTVSIGGGVMAVPFAGSMEDWEKASANAQAELKQKVRE